MPAVRWETLRQEAQALAAAAEHPDDFLRMWGELLERYADRTFRPGQTSNAPRLPAHHWPPAVLPTLWHTLRGHLEHRPQLALPLADALWEQRVLESRLLAARLLGIVPADIPDAPLARLRAWLLTAEEPAVIEALLQLGTQRLIREAPGAYLDAVEAMLQAPEQQALGLRALVPLLKTPTFENFPRVQRMLRPKLAPPEETLRPELAVVLQTAARRWPEETTPFLRSLWLTQPTPALAWLIRRVLPVLPDENAVALRSVLR